MTTQVFDKIYKIELPIPFPLQTTNVFLIDAPPRTLVDIGIKTKASFEVLKKGMESLGFSLNSIERILITHGHIDHYGPNIKNWTEFSHLPGLSCRYFM